MDQNLGFQGNMRIPNKQHETAHPTFHTPAALQHTCAHTDRRYYSFRQSRAFPWERGAWGVRARWPEHLLRHVASSKRARDHEYKWEREVNSFALLLVDISYFFALNSTALLREAPQQNLRKVILRISRDTVKKAPLGLDEDSYQQQVIEGWEHASLNLKNTLKLLWNQVATAWPQEHCWTLPLI